MDERPPWERHEDEAEDVEDDASRHGPELPEGGESNEGVRIIGAEEAAEAIERGQAATRRPEGTPRYGDRPTPPPAEGPRPTLRFPLTGSDTGQVDRPRVSGTGGSGATGAAGGTGLPHWSEPPTGEVPKIFPESERSADERPAGDDLDAWSSFATGGPRWRDQPRDWEEDAESPLLHDDESRVGALDESDRPAPDDFFAVEAEPPPAQIRTSTRPAGRNDLAELEPEDRDVRVAVITGVTLGVLALVLFSIGPAAALVLAAAVVVLSAAELFEALRRAGYQPATLLGLVATASLVLGAYWKGEAAIPLVMALAVVFTLLWYLTGVSRAHPTTNTAVTLVGVGWVGLLGAYAGLLLTHPDGIGVLLGAIIATVASDVGGLFFGSRVGHAPLMPDISPNKTVEGLVGGVVTAVVGSVVVLYLVPGIHPWDQSLGDPLLLGLVVGVVAPFGDLVESMLKRDLGIKDMGTVLPGHGGLLDRFDAMLFALPATYYLVRLLEIA